MAATVQDAISLLKADHRKVEELFSKFERARAGSKEALVRQICTELCIHSMIEEEIFYPACNGVIDNDSVLQEAYVEHDGAKVLIAELVNSEPDAAFYDAKVTVLSEMIKHHVKEEEKRSEGLLAQAKDAGLDVKELGNQMAARKKELLAEFDGGANLPTLQTRSYTGHRLVQGKPLESPVE